MKRSCRQEKQQADDDNTQQELADGLNGQQPLVLIDDTFDHITGRVLCQSSKLNSCYACLTNLNGKRFHKGNKKEDKSFDLSSVVDQTLRISNLRFLEGALEIQRFIDYCEKDD